jgi:hypothetical protein
MNNTRKKSKAIPVTGRGGPQGCETSRIPHFLDNRLTDGQNTSLGLYQLHQSWRHADYDDEDDDADA